MTRVKATVCWFVENFYSNSPYFCSTFMHCTGNINKGTFIKSFSLYDHNGSPSLKDICTLGEGGG